MARVSSPAANIGLQCPDFELLSTEDDIISQADYADAKVLVVVFMCNHCPFVQVILPRLNEFADKYYEKGVEVVGINSNDARQYPDDSFVNMKKLPLAFDYLWDKHQKAAKDFGAVCTPDFFVYDADRTLQYRGRFDNGDDVFSPNSQVTSHDLRDAVDALLVGKPVTKQQTPSEGCSLKWKQDA